MIPEDNKFERGFIILSRDVFDSSLWNLPPDHLRVALYLLLKARYKARVHKLPDGTTIGRGQLVTSMMGICEACSFYENRSVREMSRKKALVILESLEKVGFLIRNSHSKGTHITICNYDVYQNINNYNSHKEETNEEQCGNSEGTQRDTNKKDNNSKKDKKEKNVFVPPTEPEVFEAIKGYVLKKGLIATNEYIGMTAEKIINHYENCNWKLSGGKGVKMTDWKRAVNNWIMRDYESGRITRQP